MKKKSFWLFGSITIFIAFRIGSILIYDIGKLTEYGFGFLTGLTIVFIVFLGVTVILGFKIFRKNSLP